uniref:Clathrin heavy chain n=1 Tax=Panagrolaimus sp. JU765 TaxID=591449 RepID=A0AC34RFR1_9BILA
MFVYQVDQPQANGRPVTSHTRTGYGGYKQTDNIRSVCVGKNFVVLSRESGALYRYSLPNVSLQSRTPLGYTAEKMLLNCTSTRLAIISTTNTFKLFDIKESGSQVVANFERKDVWDMKWDSDKEDTIAIMEKSRLHVIQGTIAEDPVANHGYICSFKDLIVRTVEMQTLMQDPKDFDMNLVSDIEVKTLRKAKELLDAGKISDATVFIEQNSHPKLWNLLAKVAMMKLDFKTAEHAFVKLKDYGGICFVKKLETIQSDNLRKAEVLTFYGDLDGAQEIYLQADRRDLAIDMRKKMNDWREVLRLLNFRLEKLGSTTASVVTDALTLEALKHAGDWFAERQKWAQAARYYEAGRHYEELVSCYIKLDDFGRMENLANDLPDGHDMLKVSFLFLTDFQ